MPTKSFMAIAGFEGQIEDLDRLDAELKRDLGWSDAEMDWLEEDCPDARKIYRGRLVDIQDGRLVLFDAIGEDATAEYGDRLRMNMDPQSFAQIFARHLSSGEIRFRYDPEGEPNQFLRVHPGKVRALDPWR